MISLKINGTERKAAVLGGEVLLHPATYKNVGGDGWAITVLNMATAGGPVHPGM